MNATGVGSGNTQGWELAVKETHRQSQHFPASIRCPCAVCYAAHKRHSTGLWMGQCIELRPSWGGSWRLLFVCTHIHTYIHTYVLVCNLMSRCSGEQRLLARKQVQRKRC